MYRVSFSVEENEKEKEIWDGSYDLEEIIHMCKQFNCSAELFDEVGLHRGWVHPQGWTCQMCGWHGAPALVHKVSGGGWVVFVLLLLFCFIFAWVPLVTMKDTKQKCRQCGAVFG